MLATTQQNPILQELEQLDAELIPILPQTDSASTLARMLPSKYPSTRAAEPPGDRIWELAGLYFLNSGRIHEALGIFWELYMQMHQAQAVMGRIHKGMPLVWMSDCFRHLNFPIHAKRYLMLTLCEDALRAQGIISPETTGVYFRLVWTHGLLHDDLSQYGSKFFELSQKEPISSRYPEALLQKVNDGWITEFPSAAEGLSYRVNPYYVNHLIEGLGDSTGETLELLSGTRRRERSHATDYDIVCAVEGFEVDFRSELGRHFVCECKDWTSSADFTTMAKFCRVLDSIKSRFGILFSKSGISGDGTTQFAEREQLKVFQDRGIVIVVLTLRDLREVANGANLITMLRNRYETVRLDLRAQNRAN